MSNAENQPNAENQSNTGRQPNMEIQLNTENQKTAYVRRSWKMFTQEEGWIRHATILSLAMLVPIVGWLGIAGYSLEWACRTAWGADTAPKRRDVDVKKCIALGARVTLIHACYSFPFLVLSRILSDGLSVFSSLGIVVRIVFFVIDMLVSVVATIAALNATICQRLDAAYDIKHIYSMISSNPKGLMGIVGVQVILVSCATVVLVVPMLLVLGTLFSPFLGPIVDFTRLLPILFGGFVLFIIIFIVMLICSTVLSLVTANALGLWMRQFNVASWGTPFSSADASKNQDKSFALPSPEDVRFSQTSEVSVSRVSSAPSFAPIPPQGISVSSEEVVQGQNISLSSGVSSAGDAQMEGATDTSDEKGTGPGTEEDDKKMPN